MFCEVEDSLEKRSLFIAGAGEQHPSVLHCTHHLLGQYKACPLQPEEIQWEPQDREAGVHAERLLPVSEVQ